MAARHQRGAALRCRASRRRQPRRRSRLLCWHMRLRWAAAWKMAGWQWQMAGWKKKMTAPARKKTALPRRGTQALPSKGRHRQRRPSQRWCVRRRPNARAACRRPPRFPRKCWLTCARRVARAAHKRSRVRARRGSHTRRCRRLKPGWQAFNRARARRPAELLGERCCQAPLEHLASSLSLIAPIFICCLSVLERCLHHFLWARPVALPFASIQCFWELQTIQLTPLALCCCSLPGFCFKIVLPPRPARRTASQPSNASPFTALLLLETL